MSPRFLRAAYGASLLVLVASAAALTAGLWSAVADAVGPNRLVVPLRVERAAIAELFYDQGAGIRQEDSAVMAVGPAPAGTMREVAFAVPRTTLRALRFDPIAFAGRFAVGAPRLESASGRTIARLPLAAVTPLNQIAALRRDGDRLDGETTPGADDPQLAVAVGGGLAAGTVALPGWRGLFFAAAALAAWRLRREAGNRDWLAKVSAAWLARGARIQGWTMGARPGAVAFGALVVAGVELWLLWPLQRTLDWPLWDEVNYAAFGAAWAQGSGTLGELHSAPLFMASYGGWSHFGGLATAIFAQHYFVKLGSTVLLYLVLARWWRSWTAAAAVALLWGATQFQLEFPLLVYQAAWVWFLAALVIVDRWPLAGLGLAVLALCGRQEYEFAAAALGLWLGWRAWRRGWTWQRWVASEAEGRSVTLGAMLAVGAWGIAGAVLAQTSFTQDGKERAWFAFQQHYAVRAVATGEVKGIQPWLDYPQVVRRDFPGATSLAGAWHVNSAALLRHVRYNLSHAPLEVAGLGEVHAGLRGAAWVLLAGAMTALLAVGKNRTEKAGEWPASAMLAAAGVVVVAPGLMVLAKGAYLLPVVPAVLGAAGWLVRRASRKASGVLGWSGAALGALGVAWLLAAPRVFVAGERARPVAETAIELQKIWPTTGRAALLGASASSYAHYLGDGRCEGIEPFSEAGGVAGGSATLAELLARYAPQAVIVTDDWRQSSRFDAKEIARELAAPAWTRREVPAGELYWREK